MLTTNHLVDLLPWRNTCTLDTTMPRSLATRPPILLYFPVTGFLSIMRVMMIVLLVQSHRCRDSMAMPGSMGPLYTSTAGYVNPAVLDVVLAALLVLVTFILRNP